MQKIPRLIHNISALASVQVAGFFLPLLTLPYVTRVLGVESWGKVALVQIVLGYFGLVINWGFSLSGTGKTASARDDIQKLSAMFMASWAAQWLLVIVVILILVLFISFIPFFQSNALYYAYGVGVIVSNVLFPVWFLTGLEQMKQVAKIQIASKIITIPLIFIFIQTPADAALMIAINSSGGILGGVFTVIWMKRNLGLVWKSPSWLQIMRELKEGGVIFGSTVWISLYTTIAPTILGILAGPTAVGYYTLADKVRLFSQSALSPISQALFPRMSYLFKADGVQARSLLMKTSKLIILMSASISIFLWIFAENIILLIAGEQFRLSVRVLNWMAPLPFIIAISSLASMQVLLPINKIKQFNRILFLGGSVSVLMLPQLIILNGYVGAAQSLLLVELIVCIGMLYYAVAALKKG